MPDIAIVPARDEHKDAIMATLESANMHHIPSKEMPSLDLSHAFVALMDGVVVGFSGIKMLAPVDGVGRAKTTLLAVLPEFRKHGIGRMLQERRMLAAIDLGAQVLITNADRPETIGWYKKHFGYREVGHVKKDHEFGLADVHEWTTLETDLLTWRASHDG